MVPDRLDSWTHQTIENLCSAGQSESDRHDFKLGLQDPKTTTKLCCAFANSFGGFLVIGVAEKLNGFHIEGIEPDKELYGKLIAKVKADPDIAIKPPKTIEVPGSAKLIYIFEIPQSSRRPHLPVPADWRVFWKRHGSDCVQMTLEEVRYQMNTYEEKREKLTLLVMELSHIIRALQEQTILEDGSYNGTTFSFDIIDRVVVESYSILKSDPDTIGALNTLKSKLMTINAEKQRLFSTMSQPGDQLRKTSEANQYKGFVVRAVPTVVPLIEQIEAALRKNFGIENPYKFRE